jgi:protein-S-isoprenylcysteine O-methyltransferase Ste14
MVVHGTLLRVHVFWSCFSPLLILWLLFSLALLIFIDKDLLDERRRPGPNALDFFSSRISRLLFLGQWCFMALESGKTSRFHQVLGGIAVFSAFALIFTAMKQNAFFSSVVRFQEERRHILVDSGLYHFLRHPGYSGMLLLVFGQALYVNTPPLYIIVILWLLLTLRRIRIEEKLLLRKLPGYDNYCKNVRWRLFPCLY